MTLDDKLMVRLLYIGRERDGEAVIGQLRRDGIEASWRTAFDSHSVAQALEKASWSIVIAEEKLTGWSGFDALKLVREFSPNLPFVMLSGDGEEHAAEAIRTGANDYVRKDQLPRLAGTVRRELRDAATRDERTHLFAELRQNRERYRRTFEQAPIGIANVSASGRLTSVNEHFASVVGYTKRELIGRRFTTLLHPDDAAEAEARFSARLPTEGETRFLHSAGRTVRVHLTITPMIGTDESLEEIIVLVDDVSERHATTERLALQARLLDSVEQAVVATDLQDRITYWNRHAEELYGWEAAEVRDRNILEVTAPSYVKPLAAETLDRLRAGESWTGELMLQRRDGSHFPAWVVAAPIHDEQGAITGVVTVSNDISTTKRAEHELRAHKEQLAEAQRLAGIGSWQYVLATGAQTWSDEMSRMFGLPPGIVLNVTEMRSMLHPADRERVTSLARHALSLKVPVETDCRIVLPDGDVRTLHASTRVMTDARGAAQEVITVAQDVTDARRAEEGIRRYAIQQSAIANLSHLALSGAGMTELFHEAAAFAGEVLKVDACEVTKASGDRLVMVAGVGWEPGTVNDARPAGPLSLATYTLRERTAIISRDIATDDRFRPADLLLRHGLHGGATVPIGAGGEAWGFIGAYSHAQRVLEHSEIEFLSTIATILGQSIERAGADVELRVRAMQESAIAELGALAFTSVDQKTLDRACELVRIGLRVEHALLHARTNGKLVVRAGEVWHPDLKAITVVGDDSQTGKTAMTRQPVVVTDYFQDGRFSREVKASAAAAGVRSGMSVPLVGSKTFFGVLSAYGSMARAFTQADVHFMQSLANALAEAMERERTTRALVASEERYRSVVEGASEIIFDVDSDGVICAINRAFDTFTGRSGEPLIGRPFGDLFHGDDQQQARELFAELKRDRKTLTWEATALRADGTPLLLDLTLVPKVVNGEVVSMHGFARDVTERRRIERERQQLTASLQLLLESTAEGIVAVDDEGRCQLINGSAARMLGSSVEELAGRKMHALCHSKYADGSARPLAECPIMEVLHNGATLVVAEDTFWRMDDTPFPVEYSASPLIDDGRTLGVVVTFSDITERRKLERKLEQANRLSSLGRLAATVAHEFNNVLMGIAPFVEVIRRTTARDRIDSSLGQITQSIARGKRITSEILRFTQPAEPSRARVDVSEWLRAVTAEAHSLLPAGITLDVVSDEGLAIDGDVTQLHQMLTNLILNARDAMPSGGMLTIRALREAPDAKFAFGVVERPERFIHLMVRDTGEGMSAETRRHIFDLLFTTKKTGTGLGLALAHQIVMRHGGEIFVESALGAGTTFHIFVPAAGEEMTSAADAKPQTEKRPHVRKRRVLLVEDEPSVAAGIASLLELEGLIVETAGSGAAAIEAVRAAPPDVIVLDVGLPDMEGPAVYDVIAEAHPELPVIFSTGHADASRLDQYLSKPTVSFLFKPYDAAALIAAIDDVS